MARPMKGGLDYFSKDTTFYHDDKVKLLRGEFGAKGMYLLDYILCEIYAKDGYFMRWDKNRCFLVSDGAGCGCTPEFVAEFVLGCCRCSFFDEGVFQAFKVLTSAGIQRRYIKALVNRDAVYMTKEFFLLNEHDPRDVPAKALSKLAFFSYESKETRIKSKETHEKSQETPQKEKETIPYGISKERKGKAASAAEILSFTFQDETDVEDLWNRMNERLEEFKRKTKRE